MVAAVCFGSIFGFPFIIWGIILIIDRDRTWQRRLRRARGNEAQRRTRAWDRRQVIYGALLVIFPMLIVFLLGQRYITSGLGMTGFR